MFNICFIPHPTRRLSGSAYIHQGPLVHGLWRLVTTKLNRIVTRPWQPWVSFFSAPILHCYSQYGYLQTLHSAALFYSSSVNITHPVTCTHSTGTFTCTRVNQHNSFPRVLLLGYSQLTFLVHSYIITFRYLSSSSPASTSTVFFVLVSWWTKNVIEVNQLFFTLLLSLKRVCRHFRNSEAFDVHGPLNPSLKSSWHTIKECFVPSHSLPVPVSFCPSLTAHRSQNRDKHEHHTASRPKMLAHERVRDMERRRRRWIEDEV